MATEQTCSSPANPVEQDYVSAVLMTDEGITCFEYWCSTCVYSDFLSYKAGQNYLWCAAILYIRLIAKPCSNFGKQLQSLQHSE